MEKPNIEAVWADDDKMLELLNVSTARCSECKGIARVPEDVVAVLEMHGNRIPLVICVGCTPAFIEKFEAEMRKRYS